MTFDTKFVYGASASLTITLASLASDLNRLTGRESTAVDNTSNLVLDELLSGMITIGTFLSNDERVIEVWVYAALNDTPTYPDVFDGTDSAETITASIIKYSALKLAAVMRTDDTDDKAYYFGPVSVASLFGGKMPTHWGVFVTQDSGRILNGTGSNHFIDHTPVYLNTD